MPRSNWKGIISFGLVAIPIVLYPAKNKAADISFHQIDKKDHARIKYQRINANTGKIVPWDQIIKGYEYEKDEIIPVPEDILEKVAGEDARTVDIKSFINKKELDFLFIDNFYYLVPDKKGEKGYVILREALDSSNKIGIAKVIISTKEYLAAVMPHEKALILCLLKYDTELNKLSELDLPVKDVTKYKVSKKEIDLAKQLIQSMSSKWKPEEYVDEYQGAIHKWLEEAVNNIPHKVKKKKSQLSSMPKDFIELLKESLKSGAKSKEKKPAGKTPAKILTKKNRYVRHATKH